MREQQTSPKEEILTAEEREELENKNPHLWGTMSVLIPVVLLPVGLFCLGHLLELIRSLGAENVSGELLLLALPVLSAFVLITYFGVRVVRAEYASRARYKVLCAKLDRIEKQLARQNGEPEKNKTQE